MRGLSTCSATPSAVRFVPVSSLKETMFGFQSPDIAQPCHRSSSSTKKFTKHIRTASSAFKDNVSKTVRRAGRRVSSNGLETPSELCSGCVEYILDRSDNSVHDIRLVTSLSLVFDGSCPLQELHIARILGTMGGLVRLEVIGPRTTPSFYSTLAQKARFQLEYFACGSPLFDTLLDFLSTQQHLLEFAHLARSLEAQTGTWVHGQEILHSVRTLGTTARLLLCPRLNVPSLRHLTYVGGGQSLREEVRAIEHIYRLGPQLQSLCFMWGAGRTETFLDVTKFFCIASNTPSVEHLYLSEISRHIFEQFVATGLRHRTWKKLQTLVWIPSPPHDTDLDGLEPPASFAFPPQSRSVELSDAIEMGLPPRPRRRSTSSSWNSATYANSSRSSLSASTSSCRTRSSSISDMNRVDLSFRIHWIGRDLMTTFPSLRRLALWNWNRLGYDLLTRAAGGLVWTYNAEIDGDERLLV